MPSFNRPKSILLTRVRTRHFATTLRKRAGGTTASGSVEMTVGEMENRMVDEKDSEGGSAK